MMIFTRKATLQYRIQAMLIILLVLGSSISWAQENGADGLGDVLYPQLGNDGYDVQHYTIDLDFTPEENFIAGATSIDAIARQNLAAFNLDLFGLEVAAVAVNDAAAAFERVGSELVITPSAPLAEGEHFSARVEYSGTPEPINDPSAPDFLGWRAYPDGYFAAVSQPSGAMNWFPSNNHPLDKASFTFRITAPPPNTVVANGILSDVIENADGSRTFVWEAADPMATYLTLIAIGDLAEVRDDSGAVPIRSYFPSFVDPATISTVVPGYGLMQDMMTWLSDMLGDYPFEAYGAVVIPPFPGALETQTLSIFGLPAFTEEVMMHELAHQWFGNSVTVAQWKDIWLHEGFATYLMALWAGERAGAAAYDSTIASYHADSSAVLMAPADAEISQLFEWTLYARGALVLHALRQEVGDDAFFAILRSFHESYAYSAATTSDFIAVAETVSGQDLDELFDAWLYSEEVPDLP